MTNGAKAGIVRPMSDVGFSFHFDLMGAGLVLGYLLGSIPFGLFFSLASGAGDVRKIGSGNIGATNVLRTGKKWAAAATLFCDGAKGAAAVLLARHFLAGYETFAALGAVLGHLNTIVRLISGSVSKAGIYNKRGVPRMTNRIGVIEAVG